jgi:hypothetical protein
MIETASSVSALVIGQLVIFAESYSLRRRVKPVAMKSVGTRVAATIFVSVFWFAFIVLYLAFFAGGFNLWQKAAVFLASGAIASGLIAVFWVKWAMK